MRDLSAYDYTEKAKAFIEHPLVFGMGVGLANGFLAKARDMHFSTRAALATAATLAIGETILALDHTPDERGGRPLWMFAGMSGIGVLLGVSLFTNWHQWSGNSPLPTLVAANTPPLVALPAMANAKV